MRVNLPKHGPCLVCAPEGMGITFVWDDETREITADFELDGRQQGPPDHAHGGTSAAVIDEAMGASVWLSGYRAVAAHLEFDYRKPVPLGRPLRVVARVVGHEGRRVKTTGELRLADGESGALVTGSGVFVEATHIFEKQGWGWGDLADEAARRRDEPS